jgi:hypothetical protein
MLDKKRFTSQVSEEAVVAATSVAVAVAAAPSSGVVFVGSLAIVIFLNQIS